MKIAFMASDAVAIPAMRTLLERGLLACVVSNADKPKGRGKQVSPNDVGAWAAEKKLPLLKPENSPSFESVGWMKGFGADCIVVMAYGKILREEILNFPPLGCFNLHASILPKLRGASPIETAIALGDTRTGVTLMRVAKKMDAGDTCGKIFVEIAKDETGAGLRKKMANAAAKLLENSLDKIEKKELVFESQDEARATYCRKIKKGDMFLDFKKSARELDLRIRAFGAGYVPWRGALLKICEARAEGDRPNKHAGEILCADCNALKIACGKGILSVARLQAPCACALCVADFLNGCKINIGDVFESSPNFELLK